MHFERHSHRFNAQRRNQDENQGKGWLSSLHPLFGDIHNAAVALLNLSTAQGNQVAQALQSADNKLNSWSLLFNKQRREMNGHHAYHWIITAVSLFPVPRASLMYLGVRGMVISMLTCVRNLFVTLCKQLTAIYYLDPLWEICLIFHCKKSLLLITRP